MRLFVVLLFRGSSDLSQFSFDRDDSFGTVRAEAWEHCVDVGVHLKKRLDHLAHSRGSGVLRENLRPLLHRLHLIAHHCKNGAFA
jgi:hypothetical protein